MVRDFKLEVQAGLCIRMAVKLQVPVRGPGMGLGDSDVGLREAAYFNRPEPGLQGFDDSEVRTFSKPLRAGSTTVSELEHIKFSPGQATLISAY
jgi:hypothetical protein